MNKSSDQLTYLVQKQNGHKTFYSMNIFHLNKAFVHPSHILIGQTKKI